jgi:hypothetical protein
LQKPRQRVLWGYFNKHRDAEGIAIEAAAVSVDQPSFSTSVRHSAHHQCRLFQSGASNGSLKRKRHSNPPGRQTKNGPQHPFAFPSSVRRSATSLRENCRALRRKLRERERQILRSECLLSSSSGSASPQHSVRSRLQTSTISAYQNPLFDTIPAKSAHGAEPMITRITVETRWDEKAGLRTGCGVRSQVIDVL